MKDFWLAKKINLLAAVIVAVVCVGGTALAGHYIPASGGGLQQQKTATELYTEAIKDAIEAEEDEIVPLISLDKNSDMATYNSKGQVLLLSWNRHPERYIAGQDYTLEKGEIWTFTDREIEKWYKENSIGVTNWNLRLEQLIGLPPDAGYTHVSAFWVNPEDICRPAYVQDIMDTAMKNFFDESVDSSFKQWFDGNIVWCYFVAQYPWTRLGYTYDWAGTGTEYGLSEFIIEKGATVTVEYTIPTDAFLEKLAAA